MGLLFRCRGERALVERKRKERDEAAEHISLGYETKIQELGLGLWRKEGGAIKAKTWTILGLYAAE